MLSEIYRKRCQPLSPLPTEVEPSYSLLNGIAVVIFDIYGTLFISGSGDIGITHATQKEDALRSILIEHFDLNPPTDVSLTGNLLSLIKQEHARLKLQQVEYPEVEIRELWQTLIQPYADLSHAQIEQLATSYEATVNPAWAMPNVLETLSDLHQKNYQLGLISNAQFYTPHLFPALLDLSIEDLHFHSTFCAYSYRERQAKPGVHLYQKVLHNLTQQNIAPNQVLYVGNDMRNDVWPAHQLGFQTVLFAGDRRSLRLREEDNLPSPDHTITDLAQLCEMLPSP